MSRKCNLCTHFILCRCISEYLAARVSDTEAECPESPLQGQYFLSYLISVTRGGGGGDEVERDDKGVAEHNGASGGKK